MAKIKEMFLNVLLQRKICPGCSRSLDQSVKREKIDSEIELVDCRCGRHYAYEKTTERYRKIDPEQYSKYQQFLQRRKALEEKER